MADFVIQATLSNLVTSALLALIAWGIQRRIQTASLLHLLWCLVLIKMVTPPLFSLPLLEIPRVSVPARALETPAAAVQLLDSSAVGDWSLPAPMSASPSPAPADLWSTISTAALPVWLLTSAALLVFSACRIIRFHRTLLTNVREDAELSSSVGAAAARQMGLRQAPPILIATGRLAPFVWWRAGRAVVVVSETTLQRLSRDDLHLVVAHEMAHIKRRDHWLRWLEWLAVVALWWNPIMWWVRFQLRNSEELACDNLVVQASRSDVHEYANALLNMAELLTSPAIRPPVVASAIDSGGSLEKRLKMIVARKTSPAPKWLRAVVCLLAAGIMPLGLVYAQDFKAVERRLGAAVEAGELTIEQASVMLEALKKHSGGSKKQPVKKQAVSKKYSGGSKKQAESKKQAGSKKQAANADLEARKRRYAQVAADVKQAVRDGKLSLNDAEKRLLQLRDEMLGGAADKRQYKQADENKRIAIEDRKQEYSKVVKDVEDAVAAGKLSKEQAAKKLEYVRQQLFYERKADWQPAAKKRDTDNAKRQRYLDAVYREIEAAVNAGKMSKEEAQKKLIEIRKKIEDQQKASSESADKKRADFQKQRDVNVYREIEAAVKAGKLSKEEAQKKLLDIRKQAYDRQRKTESEAVDEKRAADDRQRYIEAVYREIEAAVKAGKISEEEAKKKLFELRQKVSDGKRKSESESVDKKRAIDRVRYLEEAYRDIEAAVKAGKMSKEEAQKKLRELQQKVQDGASSVKKRRADAQSFSAARKEFLQGFENPKKSGTSIGDARDADEEKRKRYYALAAKQIEQAVAGGLISKKDGENKLAELRKRLFDSKPK